MKLKQENATWLPKVVMLASVVLAFSCSLSPDVQELNRAEVQPAESTSLSKIGGGGLSFPITLHRVDLYTTSSASVSGTVTVQIRNADGSVVIGSITVSGSSLVKGHMVKNSFYFPSLSLNSGQKYRIYLTRSNPHNYLTDHISWRTSSGGTNPYPAGIMNYSYSWELDYAFATYSDGYLDQKQLSTNYGFAVGNNSWLWQEFVPQKIWVIGQ